jgi:alkylation response protein AidB-like acyl-CoA dehydrogenase
MTCLVPATAVEIIESWDVAGMRGTGSHGYRVRDAFVPAGRSVPLFGEAPDRATSPEYAIPTVSFAHIAFASIGLGGAEAVIEEFTALARDKTPRMSRALRETAVAQAALARARARVQAALAHRDWAVAQAWDEACAGDLSIAARADIRLAAVSGVETAVDVIDSLYHVAGTSGIFTGSGLQRRFQDIHVLSQQVFARPSHYENVGKILLDLDYDAALL